MIRTLAILVLLSLPLMYPLYYILTSSLSPANLYLLYHALIFVIFFIVFWNVNLSSVKLPVTGLSKTIVIIVFLISVITFHFFGWHEVREGMGASFSALMRITWTILCLTAVIRRELVKPLILLTVVLIVVDESRTYFFVCFVLLLLGLDPKNNNYITFIMVISSILLFFGVASLRMDIEVFSLFGLFQYALKGEVVNATLGFNYLITNASIGTEGLVEYVIHYIFYPIFFILEKLHVNTLFDIPSLGERLLTIASIGKDIDIQPMGGYHAAMNVVVLGGVGLIIWILHLSVVFVILSCITVRFEGSRVPLGMIMSPLLIKASPFVFFNMLLFIIIGILFLKILISIAKSKCLF